MQIDSIYEKCLDLWASEGLDYVRQVVWSHFYVF